MTGSRFHRIVERGAFPVDDYGAQALCSSEHSIALAINVPPGVAGPARHFHEHSDQVYYVIEGELELELGGERHVLTPETLVFIPRGTPHQNRNAGDLPELHLELLAPPPPLAQPLLTPTTSTEIGARKPAVIATSTVGREEPLPGFGVRRLLDEVTDLSIYIADVAPGSGGPPLHVHRFDQLYYILEGEMTVEVGLERFTARPHELVVLPAMVPHRQYNQGSGIERHVTILIGEPEPGEPLDLPVRFESVPT